MNGKNYGNWSEIEIAVALKIQTNQKSGKLKLNSIDFLSPVKYNF